MKNLFLLLLCFYFIPSSAQKIGGFYSGILHNDSSRMIQNYELAIGEYRGKVSGYAYVTFVANDTFYYGIRKVKGEIVNDQLIVTDGEMLANNFPESPAKRVRRTFTIPLKGQDSVISLEGHWQTNKTKAYYSVPGSVELAKSADSAHSALFAHLRELMIINEYRVQADDAPKPVKSTSSQPTSPTAVMTSVTRSIPWQQRNNSSPQVVEVESDSLVLSFYDNGVVDGDSVSVYLNQQAVMNGIRLSTTAMRKTISIKDLQEARLLLVAENLGSIPPNTGLLTIKDGEKIYQLNFSADLQTNASIVLRRKR